MNEAGSILSKIAILNLTYMRSLNSGINYRARALMAALAVACVGVSLEGCATAIPLPSFVGHDDDATGSIRAPVSPLSPALDTEDWRRARGALAIALDPQGNGDPVDWNNPQSGAKGSFTPVGDAYPTQDMVCRAFLADLTLGDPGPRLQGTGCRTRGGDWTITDVKPWKKGSAAEQMAATTR
jgi:surface antigen